MINTPACKANVESRSCEQELSKLSPFELKNELIALAQEDARRSTATLLNAGRGNPNWIATEPRQAFFLLGKWAIEECRRTFTDVPDLAGMPSIQGSASRLRAFLKEHTAEEGADLVARSLDYMESRGYNLDEVANEWADGIIGDHYPTPDRILKYTEIITRDYLHKEMGGMSVENPDTYDLFATEGGTAAMCYIFDSLQENYLVGKGDKIALMTPIFTPYLEIPELARFDFDVVHVSANRIEKDGYHYWQYPDDEINKLRDKSIKLVCLVNPSNPPSYTLSRHTLDLLIDVVKNDNPNLMIVTDDVYGTFVPDFHSLMYELPHNTLTVYSFSKYFGATGWRLAVIGLDRVNIFDDMIANLPAEKKDALAKRYGTLSLDPASIRFIDRLVADSRMVALNHTAGLSTPQQIQMSLFALYCLLDTEDAYKKKMQSLINNRLKALWDNTGFNLIADPLRAGYYTEIDIMVWAKKLYGDDFAKWLDANYESLDFVIRLATETSVVLLNGDGFDGPKWSVRASLANLNESDYDVIGKQIRKILDDYHARYLAVK